jgi:hypothetical protein
MAFWGQGWPGIQQQAFQIPTWAQPKFEVPKSPIIFKKKVSPPEPPFQEVKDRINAFKIPFVDGEGRCILGSTLSADGKCFSVCPPGATDAGLMCTLFGRSFPKMIMPRVPAFKPVAFIGSENPPPNATPRQKTAYDNYKTLNDKSKKATEIFGTELKNFQDQKMAFDKATVALTTMNTELNRVIDEAGFEGFPEIVPGSLGEANRIKNGYVDLVRTIDILMGRVAQGNRKAANDKLAKASLESLKTLVEKSYDDSQDAIIKRNTAVAEIANANTEAAAAAAKNAKNAKNKADKAKAEEDAKKAAAQAALVKEEEEKRRKAEALATQVSTQVSAQSSSQLPNYCKDTTGTILGKSSADGKAQIYTKSECDKLGGTFHGNGECTKKGGGSYSWDCRPRLLTESSVPLAATTIPPPSSNPTQEQLIIRKNVEPRVIYNGKLPNVLAPLKNNISKKVSNVVRENIEKLRTDAAMLVNSPKKNIVKGGIEKLKINAAMLGGKRRKNSYISRKLKARSSRKKRNSGNKSRRRR